MKLIVCLDNRNGMSFNGRRQSRDRVVTERICGLVGQSTVWMRDRSRVLFDGTELDIRTSDRFLSCANTGDYCFTETDDPTPYLNKVEKVFIFRWNRDYPYDVSFPMATVEREFHCVETAVFNGCSHPEMMLEVYTR